MSYEKEYEVEVEKDLNSNINLQKIDSTKTELAENNTMQYKLLAKAEQKKFLSLDEKEIKKRRINRNLATMVGIGAILVQCGILVPEAYQPYFFLFFLIDIIALGVYGYTKYHNLKK